MLGEKMGDQRGDVPRTLAHRGQLDRQDLQSMEEIRPERPLPHHRFEVAVGGGDDAQADGCFLIFTDAEHAALLEHPQHFGLQRRIELADLIEEQDAAVRRANEAFAVAIGAGERAAAMAEQLALGKARADRPAVQRNERSIPPLRIERV